MPSKKPLILLGLLAGALACAPLAAQAQMAVRNVPAPARPDGSPAPFATAVWGGQTLYVSGVIDGLPATATGEEAAKAALEAFRASLETAGASMDDLVSVQIFCTDLALYAPFNALYRTYFKSAAVPARAFIGVDALVNGSRFEIMGIAVKSAAGAPK